MPRVVAECDHRAEVVAEEQFAGLRLAVDVAEVLDVADRMGADLSEMSDRIRLRIDENIFVECELAGEIESEAAAGKSGSARSGGGLNAGDVAKDGVDKSRGLGGLLVLPGQSDGGVDGGIVRSATLKQKLIRAQPEQSADVVLERIERLAESRGNHGVEGASPTNDAAEQIDKERPVLRRKRKVGGSFRKLRRIAENRPATKMEKSNVTSSRHEGSRE